MNENLIKLCIDTGKRSVEKYSQTDANKKIKEQFQEMVGTDNPTYKTLRKYPECFEILEIALDEVITSGWDANPFFNQFVEYKSNKLGNKNEFDVPDNSILTVSKSAKGVLDLRRQRLDSGSVFSVGVNTYAISITEDFLRVVAGRMDWSTFVSKVAQGYDLKLKNDIYTALKGSITYLPTEFKQTGSFTSDNLQTIVSHVQASNNQSPVVITGTDMALSKVYGTPDVTWSENMKDELYKTGKLAYWRGHALLPIPQVHTINTFNFAVDDTQLYVLPTSTKPIKVFEEGDIIIKENSNGDGTNDMSLNYTSIKNYGIACIFNKLYGMYDM